MAVRQNRPRGEAKVARQESKDLNINIDKIARCYAQFDNDISQVLNNNTNWPTLKDLENNYSSLREKMDILDSEHISSLINNINESRLIKIVREKYNNLGIKLKTNMKVPITIQTDSIKITIKRNVLIPFSDDDKEKLLKLENKKSIYPLDDFMGISKLPFKITVNGMIKIAKCAQDSKSYVHASECLFEHSKIKLDPVTIMKVTNHIGEIVFNNEFKNADPLYDQLLKGKAKVPSATINNTLFIQIDGAMVHIRRKNDENNKNNDKEKIGNWHENKLALMYSSDNISLRSRELINGKYEYRHRIENKVYTSYIGDVVEFKKLVWYCALQRGYGSYKDTVLISDGAAWIRVLKHDLFPNATHILDFYHLSEKVWDFSKVIYNNNVEKYSKFAHSICDLIKNSQIANVQKIIRQMENKKPNSKELKEINLYNYIENNIDKIDYKTYKEKGYIIGSGAIESSNKCVMQCRLKQAGMRWNLNSARYMVMLRSIFESDQWFEKVTVPVCLYYGINPY